MLDIYFIRHAQSDMNLKKHLIAGRTNSTPLSDEGVRQAELLGQRFARDNFIFDHLYASSALRSIQTAQGIAKHAPCSMDDFTISDEILELDQGEWEGKPRTEIYTPQILHEINTSQGTYRPPGGESQMDVEERMLGWLNREVLPLYDASKTQRVGIVSHDMAIKCTLRGIIQSNPGLTYKFRIKNTSMTHLQYNGPAKQFLFMGMNDHAHLL